MDVRVHHRRTLGSRHRRRRSPKLQQTPIPRGGLNLSPHSSNLPKSADEGYPGGSLCRLGQPPTSRVVGDRRRKKKAQQESQIVEEKAAMCVNNAGEKRLHAMTLEKKGAQNVEYIAKIIISYEKMMNLLLYTIMYHFKYRRQKCDL